MADAMPLNRFQQIIRYINFVDNYDNAEKLKSNLCWIHLRKPSSDPGEFQMVDEYIIPFKGHLSLKQYIWRCLKVRGGSPGYMERSDVCQGFTGRSEIMAWWLQTSSRTSVMTYSKKKVFLYTFFCTISLIPALQHSFHLFLWSGSCSLNVPYNSKNKSAVYAYFPPRGHVTYFFKIKVKYFFDALRVIKTASVHHSSLWRKKTFSWQTMTTSSRRCNLFFNVNPFFQKAFVYFLHTLIKVLTLIFGIFIIVLFHGFVSIGWFSDLSFYLILFAI